MATYTNLATGDTCAYVPYAELTDEQRLLVDNADFKARAVAAGLRLGLDRLVDDPEPAVRVIVSVLGYALDRLLYDPDTYVRVSVAGGGFGLNRLLDDSEPLVRLRVKGYLDENGYVPEESRGDYLSALAQWAAEHPDMAAARPEEVGPQVFAEVSLQAESTIARGYLTEVGTVRFNCTRALNGIPFADLPRDIGDLSEGACNYGDDIFYEAAHLGLISWDGPFTLTISADDGAWEAYYENRLLSFMRENGFDEENELGEPCVWLDLPSGRTVEITYESAGLDFEERRFTYRLHCSPEEMDAGAYDKTLGVIATADAALFNLQEAAKWASSLGCSLKSAVAAHASQKHDGRGDAASAQHKRAGL